jgi:hypothetical protein
MIRGRIIRGKGVVYKRITGQNGRYQNHDGPRTVEAVRQRFETDHLLS